MFKSSRMYVSLPSGNRIRKRSVVWIICLMTTWYAGTSVRRSVRLMVKEYARAPSCPSCHVIRAFCAVLQVSITPLLKKVFSSVVFDASETCVLFPCGQQKLFFFFAWSISHCAAYSCTIVYPSPLPQPTPTRIHTLRPLLTFWEDIESRVCAGALSSIGWHVHCLFYQSQFAAYHNRCLQQSSRKTFRIFLGCLVLFLLYSLQNRHVCNYR